MKYRNKPLSLAAVFFFSSALLALLNDSTEVHGAQPTKAEVSHPTAVLAEFRGCESSRTCRFRIESSTPSTESLHVVRPNGVSTGTGNDATAIVVRNRLNALMSNISSVRLKRVVFVLKPILAWPSGRFYLVPI
jgi:hypothetical protein